MTFPREGKYPSSPFLHQKMFGVVFSGKGRRVPKMSLAVEQPRLAPVQPWGCPGARDIFGTLQPSPEKTTCSFPYRFRGNPGIRALCQAYGITRFVPCPSFVFLKKRQGNPLKKQGLFIPTEPLKSLEEKGKTVKKTRKSSQGEKTRNSPKTRKGRTGYVRATRFF